MRRAPHARTPTLLALMLPVLLALASTSSGAVTDKQVYDLGEQVTITVPSGITSSVTIEGPTARFRLIGDPAQTQSFSPREPGNYSVTLLDREGAVLVTGDFIVQDRPQASMHSIAIDPLRPQVGKPVMLMLDPDPRGDVDVTIEAPGGRFRYFGPWTDAQFVPKAPGVHEAVFTREGVVIARHRFEVLPEAEIISTDKESYAAGERITITAAEGIGSDWTLIIISGAQSSRYLGTDRTVTFLPLETGPQVLRAVSSDGRVLDEITVHAVRAETTIASGGFLLEDSEGRQQARETRIIQTPNGREIELASPVAPVKSIRFRGLRDGVLQRLRIEEVEGASVYGRWAVQSYAIDPTGLGFANATVTAKAVGTELYKCKDYDFSAQTCWGSWTKVRDITPGEEYRFLLTPEDPIFSELNTSYSCSCSDADTSSNSGDLACNVYCAHTINIPENATSFYLQSLAYTATVTINADGTAVSNSHQYGYYDHDQDRTGSDDTPVGHSVNTATTTFTWTNSTILSTGSRSFTNLDCSSWPDYCIYYMYLNASYHYQAPGASRKNPSLSISLGSINYTINYTVPGPFSVTLSTPLHNTYSGTLRNAFNFTPTSDYALANCSLYINETSWSAKNTTESPVNSTGNILSHTFSSDGTYTWNVLCRNSNNASTSAASNYTLHVDTTPPTVRQVWPAADATETGGNVIIFTYNVSDASPIANCSLYIDGMKMKNDLSVTADTPETINHNLLNGEYDWSIGCYDTIGNFNMSGNRTLNVSVPMTIQTGLWYETDPSDCSTPPCQISAAQSTDGTTNYITGTLPGSGSDQYVNATSAFIGSNGGVINAGSTVTFSSFFQSSAGNLNVRWYLYQLAENGTAALICSNTGGVAAVTGAASTGTCTPSSTVRMLSTDQYLYRIDMDNTHPSQSRAFSHAIDHTSSFFNVTNFTQLGTLSTSLTAPTENLTLLQGTSFTLTCNTTCVGGSCLGLRVAAQTNTSGTWVNVSSTGNLTLNTSETNPHILGTLFNGSVSTSFAINATSPGTTHIRCAAFTTYGTATGEPVIRVSVVNDAAPIVSLNAPANGSWQNATSINFTFTPTSFDPLANCSLYIDGALNTTNTSKVNLGTVNGLPIPIGEGRYNWSVACVDANGRQGNSTTYYVEVDQRKPHNMTLNAPENDAAITNPRIMFNWTAVDNRASNMTCQLVVNNTVNHTGTVFNDTPYNFTPSIFRIGYYVWYVNCTDLAGNRNQSEVRNFTVSDEGPKATLIYPGNNSAVRPLTINFTYNASDNYELSICSLYINGAYNMSNQTPLVNGRNNFTDIPLEETWYNWSVACSDDALNNVTTTNFTFRVDITPPTVNLSSPANSTNFTTSAVDFTYTATDFPASALSCDLYVNGTVNLSGTSTSGSPKTLSGTGYSDGMHNWSVTCYDMANNSNTSEERLFFINQTPRITQDSPLDGQHMRSPATLRYTAIDNDGFVSCSLEIDGEYNQSNSTNVTSGIQANFTLPSPAEGAYNWSVACLDAGSLGNRNQTGNRSFIIDNTVPFVNLTQPADAQVITSASHVFNWTATDNYATALVCNLSLNGTVNASNIISPNGAGANYTVSGLRTGSYNWSVRCVDNATNSNISETWDFTVLIPPRVTLTGPLNGSYDLLSSVDFKYIPSEGTGIFPNCSLYINGALNKTNTSVVADTNNTFTTDGLTEGRYDWNVTCYDTNDLQGHGEGWTHFVDLNPPYNVSLLSPGNASVVTRNNVSFTFIQHDTMSPNATCEITLEDAGGSFPLVSDLIALNATNYTYSTVLSDGNYSWNVTCIDAVGWPNSSVTWSFEVNAPPIVLLQSPEDQHWNSTGDITFTYFPDDDILIKNCSLYINGEINQSSAIILNKQNNTFTASNWGSGALNWTVGCFDSDDNSYAPANRTLYIDRVKPHIALNAPAPAATLLVSAITFNWTPTDNLAFNLTCDLTINGTVNQSGMVVNNSESYTRMVSRFDDGSYLWNVTCMDQALNTNSSETRDFTIAEPPIIMLNLPANRTRTRESEVNLTYTPDENSGRVTACSAILNSADNATNSTPVTLNQQNNITLTGLGHGEYSWTVNCTDPSGNEGTNWSVRTLYIDQLGPYIDLTYPTEGQTFNSNNISFNWTPTDFNSSVLISCNLTVSNGTGPIDVTGLTRPSGTNFNATVTELGDGTHYWNVTCVDDLGNANTSLTYTFIINQPDLVLNESGRIRLNNTNPDLWETVNLSANVSNIGGLTASNANVTFWDGDPDAGGAYIGSMVRNVPFNSSIVFWTVWTVTPGYHTLHVRADPDGLIAELNETNNNATREFSAISVNITYPPNNTITADTTPTIHFNMTDYTQANLTYRIFVNGTYNGQAGNVTAGSNTSLDLNALAEGTRRITVQATDYLGRSKNATLTLRIDLSPPNVTFLDANATWHKDADVTVRFNISDALSNALSYSVFLDGALNSTNTTTSGETRNSTFTGLSEGLHQVIVQASDEVGNTANSTRFHFYVDLTPPLANITTANNTWFNTSAPNITFNLTDNLDTVLNWTFFVDGTVNANGTAANSSSASGILSGLSEGAREVILQAHDDAGNYRNSTPIMVHIDLTAPDVTLISPENGTNFTTTSVILNFTAQDNFATVLACSLRLDGMTVAQYNLTNGSYAEHTAMNLASGYHYWNASCLDNASNRGLSETWRFYVQVPDLAITTGNITFNTSAPIENETVEVNATIFNIGLLNVTGNITVQFWHGVPGAGGVQIGGNHTIVNLSVGESKTVTTAHNAIIGLNRIYVVVDPPLATNGTYMEANESNNIANRDFWVGLFEVFAGGSENQLVISDASIIAAFSWNQTDTNGSNIFVADSESSLSFTSLRAIGRNITDGAGTGANDFEEIDVRLNTTSLNDSVNLTFTSAGAPHGLRNITAYKRTILDIPITNTTNTQSFVTGILWDASDGGAAYNGSQDIAFMTTMNQSQAGQFGTYDYEIKIPAKLRDYIQGGGTVTFYTELR